MDKIIEFIKQHKRPAIIVSALLVVLALVSATVLINAGDRTNEQAAVIASNINPKYRDTKPLSTTSGTAAPTTREAAETTVATTAASTTKAATTAPPHTSTPLTTDAEGNVPFATAVPAAEPADYQSQWDAGYLVAIDNPDYSYGCPHISLSDDDRELLEALCYGEFGSGGFIGAALIAQCVKDAMAFDGYSTVEDVIKYCRYDGSTTSGTSDECIQAVRYIFDDDGSAVQHRVMYMYNPYMVKSAFHESQNFILSYQTIRFFDRWGY